MATPTYTAIASITLGSSASSVTFSSIPQDYRDLVLVIESTGSSTEAFAAVYFNADTTLANYSRVGMVGSSNGTSSFSASNPYVHLIYGSNLELSTIQVQDYSATDKHKTSLVRNNNATQPEVLAQAMRWANTSAVNGLEVEAETGTFDSGSTFALYGIVS